MIDGNEFKEKLIEMGIGKSDADKIADFVGLPEFNTNSDTLCELLKIEHNLEDLDDILETIITDCIEDNRINWDVITIEISKRFTISEILLLAVIGIREHIKIISGRNMILEMVKFITLGHKDPNIDGHDNQIDKTDTNIDDIINGYIR